MIETLECCKGSNNDPCTVFVFTNKRGISWYVQKGGQLVNGTTSDAIKPGINIDTVTDFDCFTWEIPINSVEEFEKALE